MSARSLLSTATVNLRALLANGKRYEVPHYQRDYSWGEEHWEDIWDDLQEVQTSQRQHYMGALVLQETGATDHFRVIDGQQRIATLSLLFVAGLRCLNELVAAGVDPQDNADRVKVLRDSFLGTRDPVSLLTNPKLTLGGAGRQFFEGTLLQLRDPVSQSALRGGERRLWMAQDFFRTRLRERFVVVGDGRGLTTFLYELVATQLVFIVVTVEDELGAYAVFETLNARGLELSPADLLKNYLFSLVHRDAESSLDLAQRLWGQISDRVPGKALPELLRHDLATRHRDVRSERVFKQLRSDVSDARGAVTLLQALDELSIFAQALEDHTLPFWDDAPAAREWVRLLELFGVTQYRPIVFAAWRRLPLLDLTPLLRDLVALSFRYSVIGKLNTNQLERTYNDIAVQIHEGRLVSIAAIRDELRRVYPTDEVFRQAFGSVEISVRNRRKLIKYILCELERQQHGAQLDFETADVTIEHVLPQRGPDGYPEFSPESHERYVGRLGNYLLLEPRINRDIGDRPFTDKLQAYAGSVYLSARSLTAPEWSPKVIDARQASLARVATAIWRLP